MTGAKSYQPFLHVERAELARLAGDQSDPPTRASRSAATVPRDRRYRARRARRDGARIVQRGRSVKCPSGGHENPDRAKFCLECGVRLGACQAPVDKTSVETPET
jgi:hypothetical protein